MAAKRNRLLGGEEGTYGAYRDILISLSIKAEEFENSGVSRMKIAAAFARFTSDYITRVHDEALGDLDSEK